MPHVTTTHLRLQEQESDRELLERLFQAINNRHFEGRIDANLVWEIPRGTVALRVGTPGKQLIPGSPLAAAYVEATRLIQDDKTLHAVPLLQACADAHHAKSKLLLSHLLKKMGDPRWHEYAAAYNRHMETTRAVPAACYYSDSRTIALHPFLLERKVPQRVLKYLIYHECCHQLIESDCAMPHPPAFMEWELRAPYRDRAIEWLDNEGFPTLGS